ncbi:DUF1641 domain-containing protein [Candidatus Uabimicrobium amorphum]|uniref:DUF1641 domain-containing protein n=1 Tax=Uabimicrobium amorphum TaxID=2596890 RepID=A0A5S9IM89_UABAM|nr:DUF1641 domain-containing protein [Candidatus Uabimicrobium amorphum]BBM84314.1 hypothetical protein UABAM_02671 [Candidatus Uabimicrobium amorphum]
MEQENTEVLNKILQKIESLEKSIEKVETSVQQLQGITGMFSDSIDEHYQRTKEKGIDLEERVSVSLQLAEKITKRETANLLLENIDHINQLPQLVAMFADFLDEFYRENLRDIDVIDNLKRGLQIMIELTNPDTAKIISTVFDEEKGLIKELSALLDSPEFRALMKSGVLNPQTVKVIASMGESLVDCQDDVEKLTVIKGVGALFNSDIRRSMGFLVAFAKHFGKNLANDRSSEE